MRYEKGTNSPVARYGERARGQEHRARTPRRKRERGGCDGTRMTEGYSAQCDRGCVIFGDLGFLPLRLFCSSTCTSSSCGREGLVDLHRGYTHTPPTDHIKIEQQLQQRPRGARDSGPVQYSLVEPVFGSSILQFCFT